MENELLCETTLVSLVVKVDVFQLHGMHYDSKLEIVQLPLNRIIKNGSVNINIIDIARIIRDGYLTRYTDKYLLVSCDSCHSNSPYLLTPNQREG